VKENLEKLEVDLDGAERATRDAFGLSFWPREKIGTFFLL
jgi:hypothetical protein